MSAMHDAEIICREYAANRARGMSDTQAYEAARRTEAEQIKRATEREEGK